MARKDDDAGDAIGFVIIVAMFYLLYWIVILLAAVVVVACLYSLIWFLAPFARKAIKSSAKRIDAFSRESAIPAIDRLSSKFGNKTHSMATGFASGAASLGLAFIQDDVSVGRSLTATLALVVFFTVAVFLGITSIEYFQESPTSR